MNDYKDLKVWSLSIDFVESIYRVIKAFPKEETYALSNQIQRAVVSIPSNIAEGASRNSNKEFVQFLYIALGSASEVETQLIIARRLNFVHSIESELQALTSIRKMLNSLIASIKRKIN